MQLVNELTPYITMLAVQYLKGRCNLLWPNYQMINAPLVYLPLIASKVRIELPNFAYHIGVVLRTASETNNTNWK